MAAYRQVDGEFRVLEFGLDCNWSLFPDRP